MKDGRTLPLKFTLTTNALSVAGAAVVGEDGVVLFKVSTELEEFIDSLTGQLLQPDLVRAARRKELECFAAKDV